MHISTGVTINPNALWFCQNCIFLFMFFLFFRRQGFRMIIFDRQKRIPMRSSWHPGIQEGFVKPRSHIYDLGPRMCYELSRLDKSWAVVGMVWKWVPISYDFVRLLYDATAIVYDSSTTGYDYTTILVLIHHDPIRLATTASRYHYACTRLTTTHDDSITAPLRLLTMSLR